MSIADEITAMRSMPAPELAARYEQLFGTKPRSRHREWLFKRCAFKLQEQRLGGLPRVAKDVLSRLAGDIELPAAPRQVDPASKKDSPPPGSVLVRVWHGVEHRVEVLQSGFAWNGANYRSLSAVAEAITGAHWSGRTFFFGRRKAKETA